ncbi:hypothetical protein QYM36_017601 [Artemia franciscana]|uniref:Uncharacterized protein n=1 Tax=Artemia franciscana TaxID=6661 RepID=A0AA88HAW7_ARTSF|nr:hypothetical protein QYM36_017601 [Artemia franciscana]
MLHDKFQFTSKFVRNVKCEDNATEICKWLHARDKEKKPMPKFIIENPCSAPTLGDAVGAILVFKPISWPSKFNASESEAPSYAVVPKNLPGSVNTSSDQKRIPVEIEEQDLLQLILRAGKAVRISSSGSHKVYFDTRVDLDSFLKHRAKFDYAELPVDECKFLSRKRFSCHGEGHLASN